MQKERAKIDGLTDVDEVCLKFKYKKSGKEDEEQDEFCY